MTTTHGSLALLIEPFNLEGNPALWDQAHRLANRIKQTLTAPPVGTMRAWMQAHHGQHIDTVQANRRTGEVWAPNRRLVDTWQHATYVHLDDSIREYRGMRVTHTTPDSIIVQDDWHEILYTVSIY